MAVDPNAGTDVGSTITLILGAISAVLMFLGKRFSRGTDRHIAEDDEEETGVVISGGSFLDTKPVQKLLTREGDRIYSQMDRIAEALEGVLEHMLDETRKRDIQAEMEKARLDGIEEGRRQARRERGDPTT